MSTVRVGILVLTVSVLVGLGWWQYRRSVLVRACLDAGNIWDGAKCLKAPGAPILQRELQRS